MSRAIDIGQDTAEDTISFRQQMMELPRVQLVAMLEDATAKEIGATRLANRLMTALQDSYDAGKKKDTDHEAEMDRTVLAIWEEANGGQATTTHILSEMMSKSFHALVGETGQRRTAVARFIVSMFASTFDAMEGMPADEWADSIAENFYSLCQLSQSPPSFAGIVKIGSHSDKWYQRGKLLYSAKV